MPRQTVDSASSGETAFWPRLRGFVRARSRLLAFQLPLAAVSIVLLVWRVDVPAAFRQLNDVDPRWVLPGLCAFTVSKVVHSYRWRLLLGHRRELRLRALTEVFLFSNLANAVIPFRAGDLIRVAIPNRLFRIPRAELASSVFLVESVLDGVAFAILFAVAALFLDVPSAAQPTFLLIAAVAVALFLFTVVVARVDGRRDFSHSRALRPLPLRVRTAFAGLLPGLLDGMASLSDLRRALFAVGISVVAWLAEVLVYWMMAEAFSLDITLPQALIVMIAANLIVSIPLTPWSVGPYEVVVTEALVLIGVERMEASAYAVGSHILLQSWIAVTGLAAMWSLNLRPRDLVEPAATSKRE
jgi:uncharacterized protein (TIRG00374 family)